MVKHFVLVPRNTKDFLKQGVHLFLVEGTFGDIAPSPSLSASCHLLAALHNFEEGAQPELGCWVALNFSDKISPQGVLPTTLIAEKARNGDAEDVFQLPG